MVLHCNADLMTEITISQLITTKKITCISQGLIVYAYSTHFEKSGHRLFLYFGPLLCFAYLLLYPICLTDEALPCISLIQTPHKRGFNLFS